MNLPHLAAVLALNLLPAVPTYAQDGQPEAFLDGFDELDRGRWYVSDGWSNGDWQACIWSEDMATVEDGALVLRLAPTGAGEEYQCGEVQTDDRLPYGTFEARLRVEAASGVNAAFFTYIGPVHDAPHDEIDIEILTRAPRVAEFNTYRDGEPAHGTQVELPFAADEDWHDYGFTWEPGRIRWYVDGELVHEAQGDDLPQVPQKLYMSLWNSRTNVDWMGPFAELDAPLAMRVDWAAWTPLDAGCQFPESLLCAQGDGSEETQPAVDG